MKLPRLSLAIAFVSLSASLATATTYADDWVKVDLPAWKCEAMFPSKCADTGQNGGMQYIVELDGGKSAIMLKGDKLPAAKDLKDTETILKIFDGSRDALIKGFEGAKLIGEKNGRLNNKSYPSRDIDVDIPQLGIYRLRLIFDGSRVYSLAALGSKTFVDGDVAKKFMESFRFAD
jgi:hypothetical protein